MALNVEQIRTEERKKIAQDLHDIIANELLHLQFLLFKTEDQLDKAIFYQLSDRINFLRKQVRLMSHGLAQPYHRSNHNFNELVKDILIDFTYFLPDVTFEFNCYPNQIETPSNVASELATVIKEVLNNACLHGKASNIDVNITDHADVLSIIIEDNGVGFDTTHVKDGIGVKNIEERINKINGQLILESVIGKGTIYNININK